MSLDTLIKERIRRYGAMPVSDFMEIALTHPEHGYYMKRDPLGTNGDFITAPEISQVFGEIIGAWLAAQWKKLGSPACALVELGPGRGTLMNDMLRATKNIKNFHDSVSIHLVEASPALKQKQWATLANKHPRIEWYDSIDTLPQLPLLLVANEFFDALPIRQFISLPPSPLEGEGRDGGYTERMVDVVDDVLVFVTPTALFADKIGRGSRDIIPDIDSSPGSRVKPGMTIETCEPAVSITKQLTAHIEQRGGAALFIDYGHTEGSNGDTLQAMKNHAFHDILKDVGDADITAHVDFLALKNAAQTISKNVYGPLAQGAFLMRLGAGQRTTNLCANAAPEQQKSLIAGLKRLADPEAMGELFKVLAITSPAIGKPEGF